MQTRVHTRGSDPYHSGILPVAYVHEQALRLLPYYNCALTSLLHITHEHAGDMLHTDQPTCRVIVISACYVLRLWYISCIRLACLHV